MATTHPCAKQFANPMAQPSAIPHMWIWEIDVVAVSSEVAAHDASQSPSSQTQTSARGYGNWNLTLALLIYVNLLVDHLRPTQTIIESWIVQIKCVLQRCSITKMTYSAISQNIDSQIICSPLYPHHLLIIWWFPEIGVPPNHTF